MSHPASGRIIELYDRRADDWDRERGKSLIEKAWLDRFTAQLRPGASILDLGCGSGTPIAAYLFAAGYRLTGVDASPAMIRKCKARFGHVPDLPRARAVWHRPDVYEWA